MSPEIVRKKLVHMTTYLRDLLTHRNISFEGFREKHYEIERLLELLVVAASDIVFHLITARDEPVPTSYRAAFLRAGELGIISEGLSKNLARAAGLRNILVHEYEEIDDTVVHRSIPSAIRDFSAFVEELSGSQGFHGQP
ncbi:MAG: DUF86 domain-containing protein [Armatimonadetes bacterium]|nr:DUF86 domain-containing protein [Armatimonadota bacterium]